MKVATWNVRAQGDIERKIEYLVNQDWDIACLQEINDRFDERLARQPGWHRYTWVTADVPRRKMKYLHGVGIIGRNGWNLSDAAPLGGLPYEDRGVIATAQAGDQSVRIISFHAPYAEGDRSTKITAFQRLTEVINNTGDPLILGLDANHWETSADLGLQPAPPADSRYFVENGFFSRDAPHRLSDALRMWLADNRDVYQEIVAERPEGPLAVTYMRGRAEPRTPDRFDHVMVSPDCRVTDVITDYVGATEVGSDHAFVVATIEPNSADDM